MPSEKLSSTFKRLQCINKKAAVKGLSPTRFTLICFPDAFCSTLRSKHPHPLVDIGPLSNFSDTESLTYDFLYSCSRVRFEPRIRVNALARVLVALTITSESIKWFIWHEVDRQILSFNYFFSRTSWTKCFLDQWDQPEPLLCLVKIHSAVDRNLWKINSNVSKATTETWSNSRLTVWPENHVCPRVFLKEKSLQPSVNWFREGKIKK